MNELTRKAEKKLDEYFKLQGEAIRLLGIIVAEFNSDPKSVQCFDLRIVEEAKYTIARLRELNPLL